MIATRAAASPHTPADHAQHDHHRGKPVDHATRSAYERMLARFSHHVLHRPLRACLQLVAAILASVLNGYPSPS